MKRIPLLCVLALVLGSLAGCGEDLDGNAPPAEPPQAASQAPAAQTPLFVLAAAKSTGGEAPLLVQGNGSEMTGEESVNWDSSGPMTGSWKGNWSFYGRSAEGAARITLRHFDESFNGTIELTPDQGAICGKTSGTIVWGVQFDDFVSFGFYDIYSYGFTFHGTLEGRQLRGEFNAINDCGAESGRFAITL